MAWVERELKRRAAKAAPSTAAATEPVPNAAERIGELWQAFERANQALPDELRLRAAAAGPEPMAPDGTRFSAWLLAPDGAALGLAGEAIRYLWPRHNPRSSNNFWIRWDRERGRYVVRRRAGAGMPPSYAEHRFDERRVERIVKHMVLGRRVKASAVRRKRLWLF